MHEGIRSFIRDLKAMKRTKWKSYKLKKKKKKRKPTNRKYYIRNEELIRLAS